MPKIVSVHDDKILLVDSSIKFGKTGELLVYDSDSLFRGLIDGCRVPIDIDSTTSDEHRPSTPFQYVYDFQDMDLTIVLDTDLKKLFVTNSTAEIYQPATMVAIHNEEFNRKWIVRLRTRGDMRKQVSKFPPLKIDFSKTTLAYLGFTRYDKLKLVLPCSTLVRNINNGCTESMSFIRLYQQVDSLGYRTHLVNVIFEDKGRKKYDLTGFFIEDEADFALRTKTRVLNTGVVRMEALEREHYVKMAFFQYMILNTDFSVGNKHNLEIIGIPGQLRPRAIPYDFDYCGMVDQDYAVPYEQITDPILSEIIISEAKRLPWKK